MKRALITGVTGQDGAYLSRLLLDKGYQVFGGFKRDSHLSTGRLIEIEVEDRLQMVSLDLLEFSNLYRVIEQVMPDEVYNLAAQSFVGVSFEQPLLTADIDAMGCLRLLEVLRVLKADARFYQASTSEMFGKVQSTPQNEETPFYPRSPYGVSKLFAHWATVNYREAHGIFACSGILFNHESPLRGEEFVTRKITRSVARIKHGLQEKVTLGNLDAKRDWGFAGDYVEAMWLMLQHDTPDDYVVASGETHSVREFVEWAFAAAGVELEWEGEGIEAKGRERQSGRVRVDVSKEFFRPAEVDLLLGDPSKAKETLGWSPRVSLPQLVEMMVEADLKRAEAEARQGVKIPTG